MGYLGDVGDLGGLRDLRDLGDLRYLADLGDLGNCWDLGDLGDAEDFWRCWELKDNLVSVRKFLHTGDYWIGKCVRIIEPIPKLGGGARLIISVFKIIA